MASIMLFRYAGLIAEHTNDIRITDIRRKEA